MRSKLSLGVEVSVVEFLAPCPIFRHCRKMGKGWDRGSGPIGLAEKWFMPLISGQERSLREDLGYSLDELESLRSGTFPRTFIPSFPPIPPFLPFPMAGGHGYCRARTICLWARVAFQRSNTTEITIAKPMIIHS